MIRSFKEYSRLIKLPKDIVDISNAYIKAGKEIYLVGGAVRDTLDGITPKDYDLVTNALPKESKEILKDFRVSDEQGKSFGVIRVYTDLEPEGYEIATYRRDISKGRDTKGDDQKVQIGKDITMSDDCLRRDLTINALYYDIANDKIIDLVGGLDDIKNKIIKSVGDASKRFDEDRLRICRVFRFAARTGGDIDTNTKIAISTDNRLKNISNVDDVSQERIWEEFKKAWSQSIDFNQYLNYYTEFDMWSQIFNGVDINTNLIESSTFLIIVSNLLKNNTSNKEFTKKLIQEFKMESDISNKISFLLSLKDFKLDNILEFYKKKEQLDIEDYIIMEWVDVAELDKNLLYNFLKFKPTISTIDLMNKGYKGKELGDKIKELEVINFKKMLNYKN